jgi:hypothetical protein
MRGKVPRTLACSGVNPKDEAARSVKEPSSANCVSVCSFHDKEVVFWWYWGYFADGECGKLDLYRAKCLT